jgi:hypothetical protein
MRKASQMINMAKIGQEVYSGLINSLKVDEEQAALVDEINRKLLLIKKMMLHYSELISEEPRAQEACELHPLEQADNRHIFQLFDDLVREEKSEGKRSASPSPSPTHKFQSLMAELLNHDQRPMPGMDLDYQLDEQLIELEPHPQLNPLPVPQLQDAEEDSEAPVKIPENKCTPGRKMVDPSMEHKLLKWLQHQTLRTKTFPDKQSIKHKARELSIISDFKASKGWVDKFFKRNAEYIQILKDLILASCSETAPKREEGPGGGDSGPTSGVLLHPRRCKKPLALDAPVKMIKKE